MRMEKVALAHILPGPGGLSLVSLVVILIPWDPNPSTITKQTSPRKGGVAEEVTGGSWWNPCTC